MPRRAEGHQLEVPQLRLRPRGQRAQRRRVEGHGLRTAVHQTSVPSLGSIAARSSCGGSDFQLDFLCLRLMCGLRCARNQLWGHHRCLIVIQLQGEDVGQLGHSLDAVQPGPTPQALPCLEPLVVGQDHMPEPQGFLNDTRRASRLRVVLHLVSKVRQLLSMATTETHSPPCWNSLTW